MKILIISDTHNNISALQWAIQSAIFHDVGHAIHCGDITNQNILTELIYAPFPSFVVLGNNDVHNIDILTKHIEGSHVTLSQSMYDTITVNAKKIYISHYPHDAHLAYEKELYDATFYGHTHQPYYEKSASGRLLCNPGELQGRTGIISHAIYDTKEDRITIYKKPLINN